MQQTATLYSKLVSSLDGIVWEADGETFQFTFVSPQAKRILGYPIERMARTELLARSHSP